MSICKKYKINIQRKGYPRRYFSPSYLNPRNYTKWCNLIIDWGPRGPFVLFYFFYSRLKCGRNSFARPRKCQPINREDGRGSPSCAKKKKKMVGVNYAVIFFKTLLSFAERRGAALSRNKWAPFSNPPTPRFLEEVKLISPEGCCIPSPEALRT